MVFRGNFSVAQPTFISQLGTTITLTYSKDADLKGYLNFTGFLGGEKINLTLDNGNALFGPIHSGPAEVTPVTGNGLWDGSG